MAAASLIGTRSGARTLCGTANSLLLQGGVTGAIQIGPEIMQATRPVWVPLLSQRAIGRLDRFAEGRAGHPPKVWVPNPPSRAGDG